LGVARIVRIVIAGAVIGGGHRPFGSIVSYRRCSWYVEACREHAPKATSRSAEALTG
jgi:hypothetical protein